MFCVTLEYEKETVNSILDVAFGHILYMQAAHVLIRITCKSKKTAFHLGYITNINCSILSRLMIFIRNLVFENLLYRTMLTILLSALIIINL